MSENTAAKRINISVCSNIDPKYKGAETYENMSYAVALYKMTNGIEISAEDFTEQALIHIYGEIPIEGQYQYQAIIATGYKPVVLNRELTPNDMALAEKRYDNPEYVFSAAELADCEDTDGDSLYDFEEVMFYTKKIGKRQLITFKDDVMQFPNIETIAESLNELAYVHQGLDSAREQYGENWGQFISETPVLPIKSDPTSADGDEDNISDARDNTPLADTNISELFKPYMIQVYILIRRCLNGGLKQ